MSNEKFTQGEWVVSDHRDEVSVYMGNAVYSPYEYQCSDVWSCDVYWSEEDETAIANAHLISAAPDMYRALRRLVSDVGLAIHIEFAGTPYLKEKLSEIDYARAALAKADGDKHE